MPVNFDTYLFMLRQLRAKEILKTFSFASFLVRANESQINTNVFRFSKENLSKY